jgi:hypothetical protein
MYHSHNAGQNNNLMITDKSLKNVAYFKYLEMAVTNQNYIHEDIESKLNLSACYHVA